MQKEELAHFLQNTNIGAFIVKGMAGTGKTTSLQHALRYLEAQNRPYEVIAPTGMAAKNVKTRLGEYIQTFPKTIHAFLYERVVEKNEDEEETIIFALRDSAELAQDVVVFVDEASMVSHRTQFEPHLQFGSGNVLEDLLTYLDLEHSKRQLVFIGDPYQLPPVHLNDSIVLHADALADYIEKPIDELVLETVYRQNVTSHLFAMLTQLRNGLANEDFKIVPIQADGDTVQHIAIEQALQQYLWEYGKQSMYIAYTNEDVHRANMKFRVNSSFDLNQLELNERLIVMKNCYVQQVRLYNGDFMKVVSIGDKEQRTVRVPVKGGEQAEVKLSFQDVVLAYYDEAFAAKTITCKLLEHRLWGEKLYTAEQEMLERRALIADFQMRHKHLKRKTDAYREAFTKDPYVNALYTRFGYAVTCHKAQGGEWNNVYVQLDNVHLNLNSKFGFRWAYTALSRARERVYLVNYKEQIQNPIAHLKDTIARICAQHDVMIRQQKDIQYGIQYELVQAGQAARFQVYYNAKNIVSSVRCIDKSEQATVIEALLRPLAGQSIHNI